MNNIPKLKHRIKVISLISIFLITGTYAIFLMNLSNSVNKVDNENDLVDTPKTSGDHEWWDLDWRSRQAINITNPYNVPLTNFTTSIEFDYSTLVVAGRMNSSLKDIRIVEYEDINTPNLRKYYFKIDYPSANRATVWFDTDIPADTSQSDTYLYYGNDNVWPDDVYFMNESSGLEAKNFGWIRNGDFELDGVSGIEITDEVFGWNFSTDVPNNVAEGYSPRTDPIDAYSQHNLSTSNSFQERTSGEYSFKWGVKDEEIEKLSPTTDHDYIGTLFSYPFIVPTVTGALTGEIYLELWRNFRVWDEITGEGVGFFAAISNSRIPYFYGTDEDENFTLIDEWESMGKSTGAPATRKEEFAQKIELGLPVEEGDSIPDSTSDGVATDDGTPSPLTIDVSEFQGEIITLQFGLFPLSTGEHFDIATFAQVDEIRFTYELTTELETVEEVM